MLVSMTLYIFRGTSPSSGVQMYTRNYISYKNSPNFLLNMFDLEPTPLSLNKKKQPKDEQKDITKKGFGKTSSCSFRPYTR